MKACMWGRGSVFELTLSLLDGISPLQPGCLRQMPNQKGLEAHDAVGASSSFPSAASGPLVLWGRGLTLKTLLIRGDFVETNICGWRFVMSVHIETSLVINIWAMRHIINKMPLVNKLLMDTDQIIMTIVTSEDMVGVETTRCNIRLRWIDWGHSFSLLNHLGTT